MKKLKENQFINKFRFLHSQESSEDISWSCSDSGDSDCEYDNIIQCRTLSNITNGRKRKRASTRKKELQNISNLDITILNTSSERKYSVSSAKSPILEAKSRSVEIRKTPLISSLQFKTETCNQNISDNSALSSKDRTLLKSPVIPFKNSSPKVPSKVKKKLFNSDQCYDNKDNECNQNKRSTSPILSSKKRNLDRRKCLYPPNNNSVFDRSKLSDLEGNKYVKNKCNVVDRINKCSDHDDSIEFSSSQESGPKMELVTKVKSFFDNQFSQASHISISECETSTPMSNSKSNSDLDISTLKTQEINVVSLSKAPSTNTFESNINIQKKKVKYKKDGLSYRLNTLLKKQNSSVSLWQHERFLAANSNFVIPKQEFSVYRIKNICLRYGIYLLEIVNNHDETFIAIINTLYVNNNSFEIDSILKIYEPYKIINTVNNCKIICNICKFECEKLVQK